MESFRFKPNPEEKDNKRKQSPKFIVPEREIIEQFSKSGGPGGQNVNKRSTKAEVRWNVEKSQSFSQEEKEKIKQVLGNRINKEGELIVCCEEERNQAQNRQRAIERLNELVAMALSPQKERIPTKPTPISKEKRLKEKKLQSEKKKWRSKKFY